VPEKTSGVVASEVFLGYLDCNRPSTSRNGAPRTTPRYHSYISGRTMRLTSPSSSSRVLVSCCPAGPLETRLWHYGVRSSAEWDTYTLEALQKRWRAAGFCVKALSDADFPPVHAASYVLKLGGLNDSRWTVSQRLGLTSASMVPAALLERTAHSPSRAMLSGFSRTLYPRPLTPLPLGPPVPPAGFLPDARRNGQ